MHVLFKQIFLEVENSTIFINSIVWTHLIHFGIYNWRQDIDLYVVLQAELCPS